VLAPTNLYVCSEIDTSLIAVDDLYSRVIRSFASI